LGHGGRQARLAEAAGGGRLEHFLHHRRRARIHEPRFASRLAWQRQGRLAGWFSDAKLEALRNDWFAAPDDAAELKIAAEMETEAFDQVPCVPLGQFMQPTLYRSTVQNVVPASAPLFWGLSKG